MKHIGLSAAFSLALATSLPTLASAETIEVAIGHQRHVHPIPTRPGS